MGKDFIRFPASDRFGFRPGNSLQVLYFSLCILGTVLPYSQFVPFLLDHGLDLKLFIDQIFANSISGFAWMDVIVSSLVLWSFVFWEGSRLNMNHLWIYILSNLLVGVSLGLPLFLFMRHRRLRQIEASHDM